MDGKSNLSFPIRDTLFRFGRDTSSKMDVLHAELNSGSLVSTTEFEQTYGSLLLVLSWNTHTYDLVTSSITPGPIIQLSVVCCSGSELSLAFSEWLERDKALDCGLPLQLGTLLNTRIHSYKLGTGLRKFLKRVTLDPSGFPKGRPVDVWNLVFSGKYSRLEGCEPL